MAEENDIGILDSKLELHNAMLPIFGPIKGVTSEKEC